MLRPLALTLAAVLLLSGCAQARVSTPGAPASGDPNVMTYGHQQEPPCVYGGWIEQGYLSQQVLDTLVAYDDEKNVVPALATAWESSDDGLTWTFTLREGPTFSDGTPVDAEAIAANIDYWLGGGNSTAFVWLDGYVTGAQATAPDTVRLTLDKPYPRLGENLSQPYFGIQSPRALKERTPEQNCSAPIGSGPFTVTQWNRGQNIILDRRDDYDWAPATAQHEGPAYVSRIDWRFITDPTTRTAALRAGELDAIYDVQAFEWQSINDEGYQTFNYNTPGRPQQISFNNDRGVFTEQKLRQAFSYALDRKAIVDSVGKGLIPYEGNGPVSQATPAYSRDAAQRYSYDPGRAKQLLDEAGWTEVGEDGVRSKDGKRLEVKFPYAINRTINQDGAAIIQGLASQAEEVGFDVELVPFPPSQAAAGTFAGPEDYDLSIGYWTSISAGILWVNWRANQPEKPNPANAAFVNDAGLEDLILRANSEPDRAKQDALYIEAQDLIAEKAYSIGVYDRLSTLAVSPELTGVRQESSQGGPIFYDARFQD